MMSLGIRRLTSKTLNVDMFSVNFYVSIVGIEQARYSLFEENYKRFETKWKEICTYGDNKELKCAIISKKK